MNIMANEIKGSTKVMKWIIICFMGVVLAMGIVSGTGILDSNSSNQSSSPLESGSSEVSPF